MRYRGPATFKVSYVWCCSQKPGELAFQTDSINRQYVVIWYKHVVDT